LDTEKLAYGEETVGKKFTSDLYCIALKDSSCGIDYGRNSYDFNDGVLIFTAPKQIITVKKAQKLNQVKGWMLYFHPNLIRNTSLGSKIDTFNFFNYEVHEALHLSENEQNTMNQIIMLIQDEIKERIDNHSQQVLVSNIELLLNYSKRFYERQFNTRSASNSDVVSKVESLLKNYYLQNQIIEKGQPTIQFLAEHCHLSASYLSDLLAKETGRSAKDHINDFLINKAQDLLLGSTDSVSEIAYTLGFNYPHYFGRLFKQKIGKTPQEYRQLN
jgi:YesN/AraC family two-component response regulator